MAFFRRGARAAPPLCSGRKTRQVHSLAFCKTTIGRALALALVLCAALPQRVVGVSSPITGLAEFDTISSPTTNVRGISYAASINRFIVASDNFAILVNASALTTYPTSPTQAPTCHLTTVQLGQAGQYLGLCDDDNTYSILPAFGPGPPPVVDVDTAAKTKAGKFDPQSGALYVQLDMIGLYRYFPFSASPGTSTLVTTSFVQMPKGDEGFALCTNHLVAAMSSSTIWIYARAAPYTGVKFVIGCCDYTTVQCAPGGFAPGQSAVYAGTNTGVVIGFSLDDSTGTLALTSIASVGASVTTLVLDQPFRSLFAFTLSLLTRFSTPSLDLVDSIVFGASSLVQALAVPGTRFLVGVNMASGTMPRWVSRDCSIHADCASCVVDPYCQWCATTALCGDAVVGPTCVSPAMPCPVISSVMPTSVESSGTTVVTISGANFATYPPLPSPQLQCKWGHTAVRTNATVLSSSVVTCSAALAATAPLASNVTLSYLSKDLATTVLPLVYVNCAKLNTSCTACLMPGAGVCSWCASNATCLPGVGAGKCLAAYRVAVSCPVLTALTPSTILPADSLVTSVTGSLFLDPAADGSGGIYQCMFNRTIAVPAVRQSPTLLTCLAPPSFGNSTPGTVQVDVFFKTALLVPYARLESGAPLQLTYRVCAAATSVPTCVGTGSVTCFWCQDDKTCRAGTPTACTNPIQAAPVLISVQPSSLPIAETPVNLTITGTGFSAFTVCLFNTTANPGAPALPTVVINATVLRCAVPAVAAESIVTLATGFSLGPGPANQSSLNSLPLVLSTCATRLAGCGLCLASTSTVTTCGFCLDTLTCGPQSACAIPAAGSCPSLATLVPDNGPSDGGIALSIRIANIDLLAWAAAVPDPTLVCQSTYTSLATVTRPATIIDSGTVQCASPPAGDADGDPVLVSVVATALGLTLTDDALAFRFFFCPQSSCSACVAVTGCGWCAIGGFCGSAGACAAAAAPGDFVPAGPASACPAVLDYASASPRQGASDGGTALTIQLDYAAPSAGSPASPDYTCAFAGASGPATVVPAVRASATQVTCSTPPQSLQLGVSATLTVGKGPAPYGRSQSPLVFSYYNCSAVADCASCTAALLGECVWCSGGGGRPAACVSAPRCTDSGGVGARTCSAQFTRVAPKAVSSSIVIGVVVALIALLIICLVVAFLLTRVVRKRGAQDAVPEPPKLTPKLRRALIFGADEGAVSVPRDRVAALRSFEALLGAGTPSAYRVGVALALATPITEADRIAAALVHFYASTRQIVPFMCALVTAEVQGALSVNTLFRTNSMATKTFKVLSKLRGLDYLSATLGAVLNEAIAKHAAAIEVDAERAAAAATAADGGGGGGDSDVAVNRFKLLSICQAVVLRIFRSRSDVPSELAAILAHVHAEASVKFAVTASSLESNIGETLRAANESIATNSLQARELSGAIAAESARVRGAGHGGAASTAELDRLLEAWAANLATLTEDYETVQRAVDDLNAATDPSSAAARRIVERMQKSVVAATAGGFWFLRFVVPAVTAPVAYGLVAKTLSPAEQRLLVLVAKVLQNLANGVRFGSKESYMIELNPFITSNEVACSAFLLSLTAPCAAAPAHLLPADAAVEIPPQLASAAVIELAELVAALGERFPARVHATADARDAAAAQEADALVASVLAALAEGSAPGAARSGSVQRRGTVDSQTSASQGTASLLPRGEDGVPLTAL